MKVCSNCGAEKELSEFSCSKRNIDGSCKYSSSWCKLCKSTLEAERRRKQQIPKKVVPTVTEYGKECLECNEIKSLCEFSISQRGRLGLSSYCKSCTNIRFKVNKELARTATKKYRDSNRNWWRSLHRINQFNRRSKIKAQSDGTVTPEFIDSVYALEICYWCKEYVQENLRTLEHIVELNSGGLHSIYNITMACLSCNSSRKGRNNGN